MKKLISIMLAAMLMLTCMAGTALAAEPGETVTVEFHCVDNPGFASFGATIHYDTSALELVSVDAGALCSGGMFIPNAVSGMVAFINGTDITGDGLLFTATFTVKEDAASGTYEVTAEVDAPENASGESISLVITGGSVEVQAISCEHQWADGVVTTAPSCESEGVTTYTCAECGRTKTETIPALGHNAAETVTYQYDQENHWTVCQCGLNGEKETHVFENKGYCVCGAKDPDYKSGISTSVLLFGAIGLLAVAVIVVLAVGKKKKPAKGKFAKGSR